jgi:methylmalonyl-CoA mutase cobalamin-binding subunit
MTAPLKNHDIPLASAEPLARCTVRSPAINAHRLMHEHFREHAKKALRVLKFGRTSVADTSAIEKVDQIVRAAARESHIVVVVSAMSGVTNKLVEAATEAEVGNDECVAKIFEELHLRHSAAADVLIPSTEKRQPYVRKIQEHLRERVRLGQEANLRRELTLRERDAISGLGERLLALLAFLTEAFYERWIIFSLTALASTAFIYVSVFSERKWLQTVMTNRFLVYTGTISYGLYLLHKIPFGTVQVLHLNRHPNSPVPIILVASYALATLSWNLLEKPFLKLKKYFETRPTSIDQANGPLTIVPPRRETV